MNQISAIQSRIEIAAVLVTLQASFSLVAGLSAIPFGIVEPGFRVLSVVTILVAAMMFWLARNLRRGRRWAWRWLVLVEVLSLTITVLLALLPIGTVRGPVPVLVNLVMPLAVLVLLATASRHAVPDRRGPRSWTARQEAGSARAGLSGYVRRCGGLSPAPGDRWQSSSLPSP